MHPLFHTKKRKKNLNTQKNRKKSEKEDKKVKAIGSGKSTLGSHSKETNPGVTW